MEERSIPYMKKRTAAIALSMMTLLGIPLITGCSPQMITRVAEELSEPVEGIRRRIKKIHHKFKHKSHI